MMFSVAAFSQNAEKQLTAPNFNWVTTESIDLGKIQKDKPVTVKFEFINNGMTPLVINSAKGQCGCTSVVYSTEAIKPNEKGYVQATYNAASIGKFTKSITVTANTGEPVQLYLSGEVN